MSFLLAASSGTFEAETMDQAWKKFDNNNYLNLRRNDIVPINNKFKVLLALYLMVEAEKVICPNNSQLNMKGEAIDIDHRITKNGREPWSRGYGKRLTVQRSCVRIPAPYTGWIFFHIYLL